MDRWIEYNPNPRSRRVGDCAIRDRQVAKLIDGKLHDSVCFEILAEEFHH